MTKKNCLNKVQNLLEHPVSFLLMRFLRPCMWSKQKRLNVQDGLAALKIEELKKVGESSLPIKTSALSSFCSVGKYPAPLSEVTSTAAIMCLVTTSQGDLRSLCVTKLKRLRQSSDRQMSPSVRTEIGHLVQLFNKSWDIENWKTNLHIV